MVKARAAGTCPSALLNNDREPSNSSVRVDKQRIDEPGGSWWSIGSVEGILKQDTWLSTDGGRNPNPPPPPPPHGTSLRKWCS